MTPFCLQNLFPTASPLEILTFPRGMRTCGESCGGVSPGDIKHLSGQVKYCLITFYSRNLKMLFHQAPLLS